jgi:GTP-binding protein
MLKRPILAIVGRPNVGKSALFNRIVQKKIAIVDEAEGITRDRLYSEAEAFGCEFTLIDTGGMDPLSTKNFAAEILAQAKMAVEEADTLVMVVDAQVGVTALDEKIAKILHKAKKPLCLAVNKIESPNHEILIHPFYRLGIPNIFAISAIHGHHVEDLLVKALQGFTSPAVEEIKDDKTARVAIIGRPNVGKSTLVNAMLGEERTIVSPLAGTTRDAIDIPLSYDDKNYLLIDTAGMRRRSAEKEAVDKFAAIRTKYAIERSHLVILVLDAVEGLSQKEEQMGLD